MSGLVIESRLYSIEFNAQTYAQIINYLKHELNVVNQWVVDGFRKYYLKVQDNCEILLEYYEDSKIKALNVIKRETKEDTKCVYTMFETDMENGVIDNPVMSVYVPGERYEYYYEHDGNSADYLIAENERGYWNILQPNESSLGNAMISDNFALITSHEYSDFEAGSIKS